MKTLLIAAALLFSLAGPSLADTTTAPETVQTPAPTYSRFGIGFANIKNLRGAVEYTVIRAGFFDLDITGAENTSSQDTVIRHKRHSFVVDTVQKKEYDLGLNPAFRLGQSSLTLGFNTFHKNGKNYFDPHSWKEFQVSLFSSIRL